MMIARGGGRRGGKKKKNASARQEEANPDWQCGLKRPEPASAPRANLGPCEKVTVGIPTSSHAGRALARALAPRGSRSYRGERTRPCRLLRPPRTSTR